MNANTVIFASIGDQVLSSMVHLLGSFPLLLYFPHLKHHDDEMERAYFGSDIYP